MDIKGVRHRAARHLRLITWIAEDDVAWDHAAFEDLLGAVNIGEEEIKGAHALHEARLEPLPFGAADRARNDIEGDQPFGRVLVAVDGKGNADAAKQKL